jgi:MtN3 and saliva related transmembrane protein
MFWKIIGASAAALTMFGFLPQIFKIFRTKSARDVSLFTLLQLLAGVSLWVAYGAHLKDPIIILANSITLVSIITLLGLYFYYARPRP